MTTVGTATRSARMTTGSPGSRWPTWLRPVYLLIAAWIVGVFAPYTWMFITSITPPSEMASGSILPQDPTLSAYTNLLTTTPFLQYVTNSLMVAVGTVIITISSALLAGTALSRYRFRGRQAVLAGILLVQLFPTMLLIVPLYIELRNLGLYDSKLGLMLETLVNLIRVRILAPARVFQVLRLRNTATLLIRAPKTTHESA